MKVLVACEESQVVCTAFREKGHEAYSCDIMPCSGGYPEWHIQDDVLRILNKNWDLIIAHPPCTFLCNSGARWNNDFRYPNRLKDKEAGARFFMKITEAECDKIAIENPIGYMSRYYRQPDQIIRPCMFGEDSNKATCLWLKNLPLLVKTNEIIPTKVTTKSGKQWDKWFFESSLLPLKERSKFRSRTFKGIANAMAEQWG